MQTACRAGEVAWAAFHLAIAAHPNRRVVLRHSGRIIGQHGGERAPEPAMIEARKQ